MDKAEIEQRIAEALGCFVRDDRYLLEHNLSERCIASRLAFHLQSRIPDYSVDVEYNRAGAEPKRLGLPNECANSVDDNGLALVVPDIIVHRRGPDGPNLLGVEIKKVHDPRGFGCDRNRLVALKARFGYTFAVLIECETRPGREHRIEVVEWIQ